MERRITVEELEAFWGAYGRLPVPPTFTLVRGVHGEWFPMLSGHAPTIHASKIEGAEQARLAKIADLRRQIEALEVGAE